MEIPGEHRKSIINSDLCNIINIKENIDKCLICKKSKTEFYKIISSYEKYCSYVCYAQSDSYLNSW